MRILIDTPRWLFLATLVVAPWAYGGTRPATMMLVDAMILATVLFWLVGCVARREKPVVNGTLGGAAMVLLAQGWFMMMNAVGRYDYAQHKFLPVTPLVPIGPGVVDRVDSIWTLVNITAMLGAVCFAADLARRPVWRMRIWWTASLNGVALLVCGLGMKIFGLHITSALLKGEIGWTSFAFYYYHANAGAFINLVLPLVAGLAALSFLRREAAGQRAIWMPGLLVCVAAAVACMSKGALVISAGLLAVLAVWFIKYGAGSGRLALSRGQWIALGVCAAVAVAGVASLGWQFAAWRWAEAGTAKGGESARSRLLVSQACFRMMRESAVFGFGPGNFKLCFPHYTIGMGREVAGRWFFAHEDYLQTIVEWGYFGAFFFAVVFFGGIREGIKTVREPRLGEVDRVFLAMALLALGGVGIHALFDFPLQISSIQLYAGTYLGLCWASPALVPREK